MFRDLKRIEENKTGTKQDNWDNLGNAPVKDPPTYLPLTSCKLLAVLHHTLEM